MKSFEERLLDLYFKWIGRNFHRLDMEPVEEEKEVGRRIYGKLKARIAQDKIARRRLFPSFLRAAASITIILGATIALLTWKKWPVAERVTWKEVKAGPGAFEKVTLSDGSVVTLNAGSVLHYPEKFGGEQREVRLTGEAYFEIARMEAQPFLVRCRDISTKVLGTRFNVKAYPQATCVTVSVVSGKVGVVREAGSGDQMTVLTANEQAVYERGNRTITVREVYAGDEISWLSGKLVLRDTPLPDVLEALQHKYNIQFRSGPQFADCRLYFEFGDETIGDVISILERLTQARITLKDSVFHLQGSGCQ